MRLPIKIVSSSEVLSEEFVSEETNGSFFEAFVNVFEITKSDLLPGYINSGAFYLKSGQNWFCDQDALVHHQEMIVFSINNSGVFQILG